MRSELFKTALQNYKDEWAKCLQEGGEGKRVAAFLEKIDHQIPLSQHMFDVAWSHRQTEVDELQKRVDELESSFKHLIEMNKESISYEHDLFDKGWNQCAETTINNIYRLTGLGEQALKGGSND